ncbi:hypothetical protein V5799_032195 [Amblyomma americanum]|uniref:Uncharacterized protein n=1 Tax=Amblyomma americanum TaxID=6943 RepID=A0AAQ4DRV8_AMBAM
MEYFIRHTARVVYICSLLWNVVLSLDFEKARADYEESHKNFQEASKELQETHGRAKEEFKSFDSSFAIVPVVVPVVIVLLFLGSCIIICCIAYRRQQWFWEMRQQQCHVPPLLVAASGPGPVTYGATTYASFNVNPVNSRRFTPPLSPYPPQPAPLYPSGGRYANLSCAPSPQPLTAAGIQSPSAPPPYSSQTKQLL